MSNFKEKTNLLFISGVSPTPKDSGGATRVYNSIKNLSSFFNLYLIIFKPEKYQPSPSDYLYLKKHSVHFIFFNTGPHSSKSFFTDKLPYWFSPWHNDEIQISISNLINKYKIKFVHIEQTQLCYLANYIPKEINKVFVAQDLAVVTFLRRLNEIKTLKVKIVHFLRWLEIYFYEKKYLPLFNSVCAVSQTDADKLRKIYKLKNICVVENGIESINFLQKDKPSHFVKLGYLGSFNHPPNRTAFIFFINKIAPLLEKEKIDYRFFIAGKNEKKEIDWLIKRSPIKNEKNIYNLGFVDNVTDFFQLIDILVAPIFSGSGSRIKILESLSYGVPIISTTIGAEGINVENRIIKITNNPNDFVLVIKETKENLVKNNYRHSLSKLKKQLEPWLWSTIIKKHILLCYPCLSHSLKK